MRHRMASRHLSRSSNHRRALRRNMAMSLIQHGAIRTTEAKAKYVRSFVEKIITTAKKGTLHARRQVAEELGNRPMFNNDGDLEEKTLLQKLFDELAPRYADRPGGYTRIIRLPERRIGDAGSQVLLQLVEETAPVAGEASATSRRQKRAAKRLAAAASTAEAGEVDEGAEAPSSTTDGDETPEAEDAAEKADGDEDEETKE